MNANNRHGMTARWPLACAAAAALTIVLLAADWLPAAEPYAAQQVWLISTRHCGHFGRAGQPPMDYWLLLPDGTWSRAGQEAFHATDDPAVPNCIFLHGNNEGFQSSVRTGMTTYYRLRATMEDRPLRFVIWSWPSQQVLRRLRDDAQLKAARSDREAYLLASCLDRIRPDVPVSLVGYSFGARAATGALELLGGGRVAGRQLNGRRQDAPRRPLRAVLVAAAMSNDSLLPGHREGRALGQLDAMLVTQNSCDPVLRWYPRLYGRRGPGALGYTGPVCPACLGAERAKLDLMRVSCAVGQNHAWQGYLASTSLKTKIRQYVFLTESETLSGE